MPFDVIFIYPFITYQAGMVRAGVPTEAVVNQIFTCGNDSVVPKKEVNRFGSVHFWPLPLEVYQHSLCIWVFGFCAGAAFILWLLLW